MKKITLSKKDLKDFSFSPSGEVIDELAYCAKRWTSDDLLENNFEYEPIEPYKYDYEEDLFNATKTSKELYKLAFLLEVPLNANWERIAKEQKLQAGATVALNNPEQWNELLQAYKSKLLAENTESISEQYNKELQDEIDSYRDDSYREWLNGDYRNNFGVVYEIAKYFTDERDGDYNREIDEYTFSLNETDIEKAKDEGYKSNQLKKWLLDSIKASGYARQSKDKQEREERRIERERLAIYKAKQQAEKEEERKQKLLAMKITK